MIKSMSQSSNLRSSLLGRASMSTQLMQSRVHNAAALPTELIQTLGDNSCPFIKKKNIYDIVADIASKLTIIRPENKWLLVWHGLVMFVLLYYIFQIGLLWGYGEAVWIDELAVFFSLNCIFIFILIVDCFLCNIKAYYSHGLLVTHPRLIVKRYLKVRFYIDVLAIISVALPFISGKYALNWVKALFLLKLYSVYEIDKQFIRVSQLKVSYHTFYLLSRLVLLLILGSHYLGIWFYMIDYWIYENNYYGPNTPNICWIYNAQSYQQLVLLQPWYGQYLYTMYFSIGTMTTIAYGDITPLNPLQTLYITIALIPYTLGFAYILSQILRILMQAQASKFQHTNNLLIVSNLMKNNMIKQKTQSKVKSYFEKVWKEQIYRNREIETQLIQKLPHRIRNQLFTQLYHSFFISSGFFYPGSEHAVRTNFVVALANQIREQRLVEDHILYKEGQEYDPENLNNHIYYFIKQLKKGKLKPSIQIGVKDLVIQTMVDGNVGIEGFFTGDPRDHFARVILSVLVYELPRKILVENIHLANQQELENLFLISQSIYQRQCYICREINHNFKSCHYVTYQPNRQELVKYYLRNNLKLEQHVHVRSDIPRKQRTSYNTLIVNKNIKNIKYKVKSKHAMMMTNKYYMQLMLTDRRKNNNRKKTKDDTTMSRRKKSSYGAMKISTKLSPKIQGSSSPTNKIKQFNLLDQILEPEIEEEPQQEKIQRTQSLFPFTTEEYQNEEGESQSASSSDSDSASSDDESVDLQNYLKETELYIHHLENYENKEKQVKNYVEDVQYDVAKEFKIYYVSDNISSVIPRYNAPITEKKSRRKAETFDISAMKSFEMANDRTDRQFLLNDSFEGGRSERTYSMREQRTINEDF